MQDLAFIGQTVAAIVSKVENKETLNKAKSTEIYKQYEENTDSAYKSGVFGSPTFIYKGEVFWGDDRLEDCIKWINIK